MQHTNIILAGDALTILKTLPDSFVQTCVTSPPYYGLRDYGMPDQIGLEETPEAYIARLVEVFHEVRRVLRDDGTLWVNIGDSYAGSWGNSGNRPEIDGKESTQRSRETQVFSREGYVDHRSVPPTAKLSRYGYKPKDLIGIPWLLAFALRADGWYLRSDIIWSKSNCMPESVQDRPTKSHEYLFLLTKSERYYYDADAIREEHQTGMKKLGSTWEERKANGTPSRYGFNSAIQSLDWMGKHPQGRNKRSVWSVSTIAYSEAHFAVFPPKLIEPCILAGSRPDDIVLDCFMGAGTTALVALQHGRQYLGVELNPEYVKLAEKRILHVQQNLWTCQEGEVAV
jgi:DNA modification methylase